MQKNLINMEHYERQVEAYRKVLPAYERFKEVIERILNRAMKELGIPSIVEARAKGLPSFAEKVVRKQDKYPDPVNQFTDLCGARIITYCKDDIEPVCAYIRKHFDIDEANSEDVLNRLGVHEFGYRSVHFIVSLKKGKFEDLIIDKESLEEFYTRRTDQECIMLNVPPGPKYKAEIQVRTLLQHAWAAFEHDRLYKNDFNVPSYLQRDANRTAATLEEADETIARTIRGVESYNTYYGAYMKWEERQSEIAKLQAVFKYDDKNGRLAHRIARLALNCDDFATARKSLEPFVAAWENSPKASQFKENLAIIEENDDIYQSERASQDLENMRDPEMAGVLLDYGWSQWKEGDSGGRSYLAWATALDPGNVEPLIRLADTYEKDDPDEALKHYEAAFKAAPSDPQALISYVYNKIISDRNLNILPIVHPGMEAGIECCRKRAQAGVYMPRAYYEIGLFALLLDRPYESLTAYAKAVQMTDTESVIDRATERIIKLNKKITQGLPALEWIERFLILARVAKLLQHARKAKKEELEREAAHRAAEKELNEMKKVHGKSEKTAEASKRVKDSGKALEAAKKESITLQEIAEEARKSGIRKLASKKDPAFSLPVVIVAGGTDKEVEKKISEYKCLIEIAFADYEGIILSGGTEAGICKFIGDLKPPPGKKLRKLTYFPKLIPSWTVQHSAYERYDTHGSRFSPLEPLQNWIDMLAAGIDPAEVRLLGINGGRIAAFEYRLALTMGAKVGILRGSGRAAAELLEDEEWSCSQGLLALPRDPQTVKTFIQGIPEASALKEHRELLARRAHEEYRKNQKKSQVKGDPAQAEWDELLPDLKNSNLSLIDHIEEKLRSVGLKIRKVKGNPIILDFTLKEYRELVEKMAEMEHGRWNVERMLSGWTLGEKDTLNRKSPYLVPWTELSEEIKEYDRRPMRDIPKMLGELGYEIVSENEDR